MTLPMIGQAIGQLAFSIYPWTEACAIVTAKSLFMQYANFFSIRSRRQAAA
jgi:hypothetical protein